MVPFAICVIGPQAFLQFLKSVMASLPILSCRMFFPFLVAELTLALPSDLGKIISSPGNIGEEALLG